MPRGGKRPGAGRPRGSVNKKANLEAAIVVAGGDTPLDILLWAARQAKAEGDVERATKAAQAAAPYIHQRFSPTDQPAKPHPEQSILPLWESKPKADAAPGKKEQAQLAAETAGAGTDWGDLLKPDRPN